MGLVNPVGCFPPQEQEKGDKLLAAGNAKLPASSNPCSLNPGIQL